jgi:hypothetical protein
MLYSGRDSHLCRRAASAAAIRLNQTNAEAWLALGEIRASQGEWEEVQRVHEEGAYKCPHDSRLKQLVNDGDTYYNPSIDKDWMNQPGFEEDDILGLEVELSSTREICHHLLRLHTYTAYKYTHFSSGFAPL